MALLDRNEICNISGFTVENLLEKKATEELRRKLDERREKRQIEQRLAQVRTLAYATADDDNAVREWSCMVMVMFDADGYV